MNKQGFTLIEVIVVVIMILIMMGFAAPSLNRWRSEAAVNRVAIDIMAGLRKVRSQAISEGSTLTVTVSPGGHKLSVLTPDGTTYIIPVSDKINFEAKINLADSYAGADIVIDFYPNGSCESTLYVQVNSDPNRCVRIESRISGLSRI